MYSLTPAKCIQACRDKGYSFAGVQYAFECFCGNVAPPQSSIVAMDECNAACRGDSSIKCGGTWRMNVFKTSGMKLYGCLIQFPTFVVQPVSIIQGIRKKKKSTLSYIYFLFISKTTIPDFVSLS